MRYRHTNQLQLVILGKCVDCDQYIPLELDSILPDHKDQKGNICCGSGYHSTSTKYRADTQEQASRLANFILKDNGACLRGSLLHSRLCADGIDCAQERLRLSRALAEYVLKQQSEEDVESLIHSV